MWVGGVDGVDFEMGGYEMEDIFVQVMGSGQIFVRCIVVKCVIYRLVVVKDWY